MIYFLVFLGGLDDEVDDVFQPSEVFYPFFLNTLDIYFANFFLGQWSTFKIELDDFKVTRNMKV